MTDLVTLNDGKLVARVRELVGRSNAVLAELLVHLGEVDARRIWADQACSSMFAWCVDRLGMSESAVAKRIRVARAGRRFPALIEAIGAGRLHLSGAALIAGGLDPGNWSERIEAACGKTRRSIERLVATWQPKPKPRPSVRRRPERRRRQASPAPEPLFGDPAPGTGAAPGSTPDAGDAGAAPAKPDTPRHPTPVSGETYKVTFPASAAFVAKLEEVQALVSHQVPGGDLETVFDMALDHLRDAVVKKRFGAKRKTTAQAGTPADAAAPPAPAPDEPVPRETGEDNEPDDRRSRHIPAAVRREVYERDGGRCTYEDAQGNRCAERRYIEMDHRIPFALGGEHTPDNLTLRCATHNRHRARKELGDAYVERRIAAARRTVPGDSTGERPLAWRAGPRHRRSRPTGALHAGPAS